MGLGPEDTELTDLIVEETRRIVKLLEQVEQFGHLRPPDLHPVNIHTVLDRARRSAHLGFAAGMTLIEDFVYDDGETNRLTWVFDRSGPTSWTGRREDTVGLAQVVEAGGTIRLTYTADFASPSGVTRLGFADVIYRRPDGLIVNDAIVSRAGLPVGAVQFVIRPR